MTRRVILVTGGAGFIGSHVVEELINTNNIVKVIDNLQTGRNLLPEHIKNHQNFIWYQGDLRKFIDVDRALTKEVAPQYIIHLGASISVPESVEKPLTYYDTNVTGTFNLLYLAKKYNVKKVVLASSCSVNDLASPYAYTKYLDEQIIRMFTNIYKLAGISLRFYNVYGERQLIDGEGAVVPAFVTKILKEETPTIFGDGKQTRDFIYVKDVAKSCIRALEMETCKPPYAYEVGSGVATSINSLYKLISEEMDYKLDPLYKETRAGDAKHACAKHSTIQFGVSPTSLEEGLKKAIAYYKEVNNG
jgi:nucleoside-diphosphate-sugar epimerase